MAWLADRLIERARPRWVASPAGDVDWMSNYRLKAEARRCAELATTPAGRAAIERKVASVLAGFDEPVENLAGTKATGDEGLVVGRKVRGVISFQGQDAALQAKFAGINWDSKAASVLYWADGKRTIAQLRRLAEAEWGTAVKTDLVSLFRAAAQCGMVTLSGA